MYLRVFFNDFKILPLCFTILIGVIFTQKGLEEKLFIDKNINFLQIFFSYPFLLTTIFNFLVSHRGSSIVQKVASVCIMLLISTFFVCTSLSLHYSQILKKLEKVGSFIGKNIVLEGYISSVESNTQYILKSDNGEIGNVILKVSEFTVLQPGFRCKVSGKLVEPKSFEDFDYKKYLYRKGIFSILEVNRYECKQEGFNLLLLRSKLESVVSKGLSEPEGSLLIGILFGSKRVFTKEFSVSLQNSGLSHIISASGYNVALVASLVDRGLRGYTGKVSLILKITVVWIFAIFAGLSSSLIRASTMSSIYFVSLLFGRDVSKGILIVFCITVLVLIKPSVIYDIGFLLSSSATLGLIFFPKCFNFKSKWVNDSLIPTITCTIFTLPVVMFFFNKISLASVLSNLIAAPIVQSTLGWGVLAILLNSITPIFQIFFFIPYVQLNIFKYIVEISSYIPVLELSFDPKIPVYILCMCIFLFCLLKYPISNENYYLKKAKSLLN